MSRKELERLKADVEKALERVGKKEMQMAREAAEKAAAAHGYSLADLTGEVAAPKKRGRKAAAAPKAKGTARFANPADPSQTWTGKGRQPQWFKDAVSGGADPATLAV